MIGRCSPPLGRRETAAADSRRRAAMGAPWTWHSWAKVSATSCARRGWADGWRKLARLGAHGGWGGRGGGGSPSKGLKRPYVRHIWAPPQPPLGANGGVSLSSLCGLDWWFGVVKEGLSIHHLQDAGGQIPRPPIQTTNQC